jgi:UDP-N-acetylglucosamine pyrophosphorylase
VNFKHRFSHKDQGGFPKLSKEGQLLVMGKKKADTDYPFGHGEVINYTVSIHPVTTKIQAFFLL